MNNTKINDKFYADLLSVYKYNKLQYLYNNYLYKIEKFISSKTFFYSEVNNPRTNKNTSEYMEKMLFAVYSDKNLFFKFLDLFSGKIKRIFNIVVNSGNEVSTTTLSEKIKEKINVKLSIDTKRNEDNILYFLFTMTVIGNIYFVSMPESVKEVLREYFYDPENIKLNPVKLPPDINIYENKGKVFNELNNSILFLENFNIDLGTNSRIPKPDLQKISKVLNLEEFYEKNNIQLNSNYKELSNIKITLLITFLIQLKHKYNKNDNTLELLKDLFKEYESINTSFYSYTMLFHVHFSSFFLKSKKDYIKNTSFHKTMITVLKNLPDNKWIGVDNIYNHILLNDYYIKIVTEYTARDFYVISSGGSKSDRIYIKDSKLYNDLILKSTVRASMFLFSSLGLVDIAYALPDDKNLDNQCFTPFDGLKYVRLSDLGKYILGLTDNYNYIYKDKEKTKITLDEKNLIIRMSKPDKLKGEIISIFAKQISDKVFVLNTSYFMDNCENKTNINNKIKDFKKNISSDLPEIWQKFFKSLINKANFKFERQDDYIIYKVPDNNEIIDLIYKDDILSKNITKMEDFQIAVKSENLSKVKNRFKEFGFLL